MVVHVHMFSFLPSQRRATTGALPAAVRPSLWADPTSPSPPLHTVSLCTIRTVISALATQYHCVQYMNTLLVTVIKASAISELWLEAV